MRADGCVTARNTATKIKGAENKVAAVVFGPMCCFMQGLGPEPAGAGGRINNYALKEAAPMSAANTTANSRNKKITVGERAPVLLFVIFFC